MRELKFRAWHVNLQRMFSAEEMATDQLTLLPTGLFINVSGTNESLSRIYGADEMTPLQYTGLKDKNGVEIYEGDVVRGDRGAALVEFLSGAFCVKYSNGDTNLIARDNVFTVIGNIYEHPQLIEDSE